VSEQRRLHDSELKSVYEKKDFENNLKRISFYLKIYSLYHNPLLFYNINYKEDSVKNISFEDFWNYEYQLENIDNDIIFDDFMKNFNDIYPLVKQEERDNKIDYILDGNKESGSNSQFRFYLNN
jgi:hypothetical protein